MHDHLGRADELGAQLGILRCDTDGARVQVTLPRHHAAGRHRCRGPKPILICAEQGRDHHIASGLHAAIRAQDHAVTQPVGHERLLRLRNAQLPRDPCILDGAERGCPGAAIVAAD